MERGLEVFLNCEINPRDPAGVTMPYRVLIPTLSFDGEFEPWTPLEEKKPASTSLSSSWWARISRRTRKYKAEEHPSKANGTHHVGNAAHVDYTSSSSPHNGMLDETDRGFDDEISDEDGDDDSETSPAVDGSGLTRTDTGDGEGTSNNGNGNNSGKGKKKFLGLISLSK